MAYNNRYFYNSDTNQNDLIIYWKFIFGIKTKIINIYKLIIDLADGLLYKKIIN